MIQVVLSIAVPHLTYGQRVGHLHQSGIMHRLTSGNSKCVPGLLYWHGKKEVFFPFYLLDLVSWQIVNGADNGYLSCYVEIIFLLN